MRPLVPAFQAQQANKPKWTSFSALHGKLKIHVQLALYTYIAIFSLMQLMDGEIDKDVEQRLKAALLKWRLASEVLCNWHIPTTLKGKVNKIAIRPAMTYGA